MVNGGLKRVMPASLPRGECTRPAHRILQNGTSASAQITFAEKMDLGIYRSFTSGS
jgi:hypothetical protein